MLEAGLNPVGYSDTVGCVVPRVSKDHHAFMFRDCLTLQMKPL
jgi:hypothetical protein